MKVLFLFLYLFSSDVFSQDREVFRGLLKESLERDPQFKEVDLQTPLIDARLKQSFSALVLPKFQLSYGQYYQKAQQSIISQDKYRIGSFGASFDLFSFGSDWKNYQSSRLEVKAQNNRVMTRLMERESEIGALILNYLKEAKNLSILLKIVELKEKALDVSKNRYQRGSLSEEDYNKVKIDVSNARAEWIVTQQSYNIALAEVKSFGLVNIPQDYPWENEFTQIKIQDLLKLSIPVNDLPQFQEISLAEEASEYRKDATRNLMFGKVQVNFSRNLYDFEEVNQWDWRMGIVYTLPLFDSFNQYAAYKVTDVQQRLNEVKKKFERNRAEALQSSQNGNLQLTWKNWNERLVALKLSNKLYSSSLSQFNQGKLSVNELLVDQDRLLRTEIIANLALYQLHTSVLAFCHSRGKAYVRGCLN